MAVQVACLSQQFMALEIKAQSVLNHLIACYELQKKTHYCGILLYKTTHSRKDIQTICNVPRGSLYQFRILSRELHQLLSNSQRSNKSCVLQYGAIKFGDSQTYELITRLVKCKKKKVKLPRCYQNLDDKYFFPNKGMASIKESNIIAESQKSKFSKPTCFLLKCKIRQ